MNNCVLIVDDDQEFLELLTEIFEQADFQVFTAYDAEFGMEVLGNEEIELVITDQRLPGGQSGSDFILNIREKDANLPVIMISGFLDDQTIRDLIRDGVEGIFIKPLNIFSLLKKTREILEERSKAKAIVESSVQTGENSVTARDSVGFIDGHSEAGAKFLMKARELASFRRNLLLIGPTGTLFEEIALDIIELGEEPEHCVTLRAGQITSKKLSGFFEGDHANRRLALILEDAEKLTPEEVDLLIQLSEEKGGTNGILRMIFCLSRTVEELYDSGVIEEELYLFLGSNELKVPPLKKMPEDLVAIAIREIEEQCREFHFDAKTRSVLLEHDWPGNMMELRSVIVRAISLSQPMPPHARHFHAAMHPNPDGLVNDSSMRSSLERFLTIEKYRYSQAVDLLLNSKDPKKCRSLSF